MKFISGRPIVSAATTGAPAPSISNVEDGNVSARHLGQWQLHRPLNLLLFADGKFRQPRDS